jgi:hypothetical protein
VAHPTHETDETPPQNSRDPPTPSHQNRIHRPAQAQRSREEDVGCATPPTNVFAAPSSILSPSRPPPLFPFPRHASLAAHSRTPPIHPPRSPAYAPRPHSRPTRQVTISLPVPYIPEPSPRLLAFFSSFRGCGCVQSSAGGLGLVAVACSSSSLSSSG